MIKPAVAPENISEISCLLMPNQGFRLILPNTAVAEIVGWRTPDRLHATNSDWLLGFFEWREQRLPLLSIEIADQAPVDKPLPFTKIAVLNVVSENFGFQYYGLALCGIPKLVRIGRDEISVCTIKRNQSASPAPTATLSLKTSGTKVTFNGEQAWLPDLDQVEQQVSSLFQHP